MSTSGCFSTLNTSRLVLLVLVLSLAFPAEDVQAAPVDMRILVDVSETALA